MKILFTPPLVTLPLLTPPSVGPPPADLQRADQGPPHPLRPLSMRDDRGTLVVHGLSLHKVRLSE